MMVSGSFGFLRFATVRAALTPLSWVYYAGYRMKRRSVVRRPKSRLPVPVVSVGNVTVGGTGKTPTVRHLARVLAEAGRKPGICIRGYGRTLRAPVVFTGADAPSSWETTGDEALLYARDGVAAVGVDAVRERVAMALIDRYGCGVILLDDGFQYRTMHRDLNVALVDVTRPFGFGRLLPAGTLREPVGVLSEADLLWVTRADMVEAGELRSVLDRLEALFPGKPVVVSRFRPRALRRLSDGTRLPPDALGGKRAVCVSGIGNPEPFERLVESLSGAGTRRRRFPDHHPFTLEELKRIEVGAARDGAGFVVVTEKDSVRIASGRVPSEKWAALEIETEILAGGDALLRKLESLTGHAAETLCL
ncbi:MAG: tetraacyldisaccharide 4'-kinase [bacterium]